MSALYIFCGLCMGVIVCRIPDESRWGMLIIPALVALAAAVVLEEQRKP